MRRAESVSWSLGQAWREGGRDRGRLSPSEATAPQLRAQKALPWRPAEVQPLCPLPRLCTWVRVGGTGGVGTAWGPPGAAWEATGCGESRAESGAGSGRSRAGGPANAHLVSSLHLSGGGPRSRPRSVRCSLTRQCPEPRPFGLRSSSRRRPPSRWPVGRWRPCPGLVLRDGRGRSRGWTEPPASAS